LVSISECTLADNIHNAYAPFNEAITSLKKITKEDKTVKEIKSKIGKHLKKGFNILTKSGKNIASTSMIGAGIVGIVDGIETEYFGKKEKEKEGNYDHAFYRPYCRIIIIIPS